MLSASICTALMVFSLLVGILICVAQLCLACRIIQTNYIFIFSGKYNGGTSKGTKDPKYADPKEARAVCAVGVVYRSHLGKTKTTL